MAGDMQLIKLIELRFPLKERKYQHRGRGALIKASSKRLDEYHRAYCKI